MANKDNENMEQALASQIGNLGGSSVANDDDANLSAVPTQEEVAQPQPKKLQFYGKKNQIDKDETEALVEEKHLSRIGEKIGEGMQIRDGWMDVERELLGERSKFYPEDWIFRIKPATVEAIRNWSTIDEKSPNSIDIVFDEILKSCLSIRTSNGPLPWNQINAWDRFFFVLLIREYTFEHGECKVEFKKDCSNCETEVTFELTSQALTYDLPEPDVMKYYIPEARQWVINPSEFDVIYPGDEVVLYLPTREKDANIKQYFINKYQEDNNAKFDRVFLKFLPWMIQKISKDPGVAKNQIRKAENEFRSWDVDMFEFMDNVITNIQVTPGTDLVTVCPACGEEVTAPIQFPDGISVLFRMAGKGKRFGSK